MFNILVDFQDRFQTLFLEGSQQESGCCSDTWVAGGTLSTEREEQESDILTSQKLSFREGARFLLPYHPNTWKENVGTGNKATHMQILITQHPQKGPNLTRTIWRNKQERR